MFELVEIFNVLVIIKEYVEKILVNVWQKHVLLLQFNIRKKIQRIPQWSTQVQSQMLWRIKV